MRPLIAIPATIALVVRAYTRKSLTTPAIFVATLTAVAHALHPSSLPFTLLVVFFLLGTTATKVKHEVKANLTLSASGSAGGEGPRNSIQVLANSAVVSVLCLLHVLKYGFKSEAQLTICFGNGSLGDLIMFGIIANYAAVTADTLSSELGILSRSRPRLITTLKTVPPGTNGGVTLAGLLAGAAGSAIIGFVSILLLNFCDSTGQPHILARVYMIGYQDRVGWNQYQKIGLWLIVTVWGTLGSLLDSWLGAMLQASVIDRRTGKVIEGAGGKKVLITAHRSDAAGGEKSKREVSRMIGSGRDILDNNQINFLMAAIMSFGGIVVGGVIMNISTSNLLQ